MSPRRTTIISIGLLAFLVGLMAAKSVGLNVARPYFLALLPFVFVFRKWAIATLLVAAVLGLQAGVWRGGQMAESVSRYESLVGENVTVSGRIADDPVYDKEGRLDFRLGSVNIDGVDMPGQVRIKAHVNGLRRGDSVRAGGRMSEGFGNYQASMYFANVSVIAPSKSLAENVRRKFFTAVYNVLPEPQASLGLGFLVGLRSALPEDLSDQLRIAGLTHIIVASGYNLTILVRLSRRTLAKYSKYQAFAGSIALIFVFLAITGASPSMVRASVVTVLSLLAWYYGRRFQPVLIILMGAAITAGYSPLYIWHDLGWWLSFLAFAGVLIIAPLLTSRLWKDRQPPLLAQVAIETSSAQIMATPLILFVFGEISLVALVANIAVVPFIPFAMAATLIAGIGGVLLSAGWGALLAVPADAMLGYIVSVTRFFASPDWAQQSVKVGGASMAVCYASVAIAAIVLYRKSRIRFSELPSVVE